MIKLEAKAAAPLVALCMAVDVLMPVFSLDTTTPAQGMIPALCMVLACEVIITKLLLRCNLEYCLSVKFVCFTLAIAFLFSAAELFSRMVAFYHATSVENLPTWIMLILVIALLAICIRFDIQSLARVGGIAIIPVIISIFILIFANCSHADIGRISYLPFDLSGILKGFASVVYFPLDIILYLIICKDEEKIRANAIFKLLFIVTGVAIALCFMRELVLGMPIVQGESLHTLARLGGLSVFKRIESIHVFVWTFAALIKLIVFFMLSVRLQAENKTYAFPLNCVLFIIMLWVQTPLTHIWIMHISGAVVAWLIFIYHFKSRRQNEKVL